MEVLNDINGELVNLYRVVKHHLEEFVRQFKWALTSRPLVSAIRFQCVQQLPCATYLANEPLLSRRASGRAR